MSRSFLIRTLGQNDVLSISVGCRSSLHRFKSKSQDIQSLPRSIRSRSVNYMVTATTITSMEPRNTQPSLKSGKSRTSKSLQQLLSRAKVSKEKRDKMIAGRFASIHTPGDTVKDVATSSFLANFAQPDKGSLSNAFFGLFLSAHSISMFLKLPLTIL